MTTKASLDCQHFKFRCTIRRILGLHTPFTPLTQLLARNCQFVRSGVGGINIVLIPIVLLMEKKEKKEKKKIERQGEKKSIIVFGFVQNIMKTCEKLNSDCKFGGKLD